MEQGKHPIIIAREEKNIGVRALARKLPLGRSGYNRVCEWESGKSVPTIALANALAAELGFESGEKIRQICQEWKSAHFPKIQKTDQKTP